VTRLDTDGRAEKPAPTLAGNLWAYASGIGQSVTTNYNSAATAVKTLGSAALGDQNARDALAQVGGNALSGFEAGRAKVSADFHEAPASFLAKTWAGAQAGAVLGLVKPLAQPLGTALAAGYAVATGDETASRRAGTLVGHEAQAAVAETVVALAIPAAGEVAGEAFDALASPISGETQAALNSARAQGALGKTPVLEVSSEGLVTDVGFSAQEAAIADHLRALGRQVVANPFEGVGIGRQADAFVDGVLTEFKTLAPGASSSTVRNVIRMSKAGGGQARSWVLDASGSGLSAEEAVRGINRAFGASPEAIDRIEIIGADYFVGRGG
jgi:hypothetical protein